MTYIGLVFFSFLASECYVGCWWDWAFSISVYDLKQWRETKARKEKKCVLEAGVTGPLVILKSCDENAVWQSEEPPHHSGDALTALTKMAKRLHWGL